jgi:hypothetical protein
MSGAGGFDPAVFSEFQDIFGGFSFFENLFGAAFAGRSRGGTGRGADLRYDLELDFLEAARGTQTRVVIPRLESCEACDGSGAARGLEPHVCRDAHRCALLLGAEPRGPGRRWHEARRALPQAHCHLGWSVGCGELPQLCRIRA